MVDSLSAHSVFEPQRTMLQLTTHCSTGDDGSEEVAVVKKVARPTKDAPLAFSTKAQNGDKLEVFKFESSKQLQQTTDQGATRTNEAETAHDRDARQASLPSQSYMCLHQLALVGKQYVVPTCLPTCTCL